MGERLNDEIWKLYYTVIKELKAFFTEAKEIITPFKNSVHQKFLAQRQ